MNSCHISVSSKASPFFCFCYIFCDRSPLLENSITMLNMDFLVPQRFSGFIDKCFLVTDDIGVVDGGKNPDLIQCVLFLFLRQWHHLHSFQCVGFFIFVPHHLVDRAISSFTQLRYYFEIANRHPEFWNIIIKLSFQIILNQSLEPSKRQCKTKLNICYLYYCLRISNNYP